MNPLKRINPLASKAELSLNDEVDIDTVVIYKCVKIGVKIIISDTNSIILTTKLSARPYLFTEKENPTCLNTALEETPCMNGIVGGSDTISDRSWPWQIQLVGSWMCGGALITPRTVVTASHCLKNTYARDWQVSAGHVNKDQTIASREPGFQRKPVIRILKHRDYNDAYQNDITLLFVRDPFLYTNYVRPACLPGSAQYNCKLHSGTKCIISGWGDTRQSSQTYDLALQHTTVPIVARTECRVFNKYFDIYSVVVLSYFCVKNSLIVLVC